MIRLFIARHGNTFDKGDTVLRVGARTDLPLSSSGREQAHRLGDYLATHYPQIDQVYTSRLRRTQETAQITLSHLEIKPPQVALAQFDEIDYGPDEGRPESEVVARLGQEALSAWDNSGVVPEGWQVSPLDLEKKWCEFANQMTSAPDRNVFVVTSNGIARYAQAILSKEQQPASMKLSTGALGCLLFDGQSWTCEMWNHRP